MHGICRIFNEECRIRDRHRVTLDGKHPPRRSPPVHSVHFSYKLDGDISTIAPFEISTSKGHDHPVVQPMPGWAGAFSLPEAGAAKLPEPDEKRLPALSVSKMFLPPLKKSVSSAQSVVNVCRPLHPIKNP